jgi:phage gpG-like protein
MKTTVTIDDTQVMYLMGQLQVSMDNFKKPMQQIGAMMVSEIHLKLGIGVTPWGDAMKPLKYKRKHANAPGEGIPLNDTRMHIYQRINYQADDKSVRVGMLDSSTAKIGQVHQYGMIIIIPEHKRTLHFKVNMKTGKSRFSKKNKANFSQDVTIPEHEISIPSRPFMPIRGDRADLPSEWTAKIIGIISDFLPVR